MISTVEIDMSMRQYAQDILRNRIMGNEVKSDLYNTIAEVAFCQVYGTLMGLDDLVHRNKRALNFVKEDINGRLIRVCNRIAAPYRVYAKHLDADRYVFCSTSKDMKTCTFHGWLDADEVVEAPVFWFTEAGKRTDYCHEIDKNYMYAMPDTMDFPRPCEHRFSMWDYLNHSWLCYECDKACYDTMTSRRVDAGIDAR